MNCREAEQLIPLFVEADLDAAAMQQVTRHLETCSGCCELVAEFEASQSLLRSAAVPTFDETMLAEMRRAVMQQVDQTPKQPLLGAWWQSLWDWKFAFAAAAVILLVLGVAIRQRGAKTVDTQVASGAKESKSALPEVRENSEAKLSDTTPRLRRRHKAQSRVNVSELNLGSAAIKQVSPEKTDIDNQIAIAVAPSGAGNTVATLPGVGTPGFMLPPASQAENGSFPSTEKSAPEPEMLRMEIQTADPNIRIIWLTPKSALASK